MHQGIHTPCERPATTGTRHTLPNRRAPTVHYRYSDQQPPRLGRPAAPKQLARAAPAVNSPHPPRTHNRSHAMQPTSGEGQAAPAARREAPSAIAARQGLDDPTPAHPARPQSWMSDLLPAGPGPRFDPSVPHPARVVRYLAGECGIRQYLDIGTGLPTPAPPTRSPRPSRRMPASSTATTTPGAGACPCPAHQHRPGLV